VSIVSVGVATLIWIGVWWLCWWCPLSLSLFSLEGEEQGRDERVRNWSPWTKRSPRESEWIVGGQGMGEPVVCVWRITWIRLILVRHLGQLRWPQGLENTARGKHLLFIVLNIFVRQHLYYFCYTCMSSWGIEHEHKLLCCHGNLSASCRQSTN